MNGRLYITHSVRLRNLELWVDEKCISIEATDTDSFLTSIYKYFSISYPKFYKMDTLSKAGFLSAELIFKQIEIEISPFKKGIVLQNTSSSLDTDIRYQESIQNIASPALFVYTLPNIVMGEIAIRNHIKGENTFFVSDQFTPHQLVDYTKILFDEDILELALIGYLEVRNNVLDILICLVEKQGDKPFSEEALIELYSVS